MPDEIEKKYATLKKKYKLPDFEDIDFEFEISHLEHEKFVLRGIIRRIAEKLDFFSTMLEEQLQPDTSNLYAMHETRFFDESQKKKMYDLYSKLMMMNRSSIEVMLEGGEEREAEFIVSVFSKWKGIKEELMDFVNKIKLSWETEVDIKEDIGYLG